jgi:hypothetical protein
VHGDGLDLYELLLVAKTLTPSRMLRGIMVAEAGAHDVPDADEVGPLGRGDVDRGLDDVGQFGAGGLAT